MRWLIVGAQGQLGTDLQAVLPGDVVGLDLPDFDATDDAQVAAAFDAHRPDVAINCVAMTNVDACETETEAAWRGNALTALQIAQHADRVGAAVCYVSTDYVFGQAGARAAAYLERDAPGPVNVYGATKLAGEHLTMSYARRWCVVRTSGLYGRAGARGKGGNFVETMLRLARERDEVRVVNDQRLSPTSTAALARRMAELLQRDAHGIYHLAAADSCTWHEFAAAIFAETGARIRCTPIPSSEYPTPARRPAMSALGSARVAEAGLAPPEGWRAMLRTYLNERDAEGAQA